MKLPVGVATFFVGFGLVIINIVLSWMAAIVSGGFKFGSLERTVSFDLTREEYPVFWQRMLQRLAQIGFQAGPQEGVFQQSGAQFGDMATFTHAKTKKELRVTPLASSTGVTLDLSLRYLDPIVGDSGESAYRDAVLDFISGGTDSMQKVPNRSFGALSAFVGGLLACFALVVLKAIGLRPVLPPILVLTIAEIFTAGMAIFAIRSKPGELTGTWLAVSGIALSVIAIAGAGILEILNFLSAR